MTTRFGVCHDRDNLPLVTEVSVGPENYGAVRVYGPDESRAIFNAALVLACRDGWADGEGSHSFYLEKAKDWLDDEGQGGDHVE